MPLTFDPDLIVDREQELAQLIEWATVPNVRYRLKSIAAPPGYGKSWLLSEFVRRLSDRDDLFIIRVPTLRLKSKADIDDWLPSVVKAAREICLNVRQHEGDTLPESILRLLDDLCENCIPALRPLLIVDGFDELSDDERQILESHLLQSFWRNECTRIAIAFRDELSLYNSRLRRVEDRMNLNVFIPQYGEEQLQKRVEKDKITKLSITDLRPLIPLYTWTHPEVNCNLYEIAKQKIKNNKDLSFTADELRDSWLSLVKDKLYQVMPTRDTYLFKVELEKSLIDNLGTGQLPAKLREQFKENGEILTSQAQCVKVEQAEGKWMIVDAGSDKKYLIQSENNNQALDVYLDTIEADLKIIAGHKEDTWTIKTYGQLCGCSELEASRRVQKLMELSLVANEGSRFKIVDGIREIIRAEMDIRTLGQKKQKQELSS